MSDALNAPELFLSLNQTGFDILLSRLEERILNKIRRNPEEFLPESIDPEEFEFYTVAEAAEKLQVAASTIRNHCKEGKLTYCTPNGRSILITKKSLKNFLKTIINNSKRPNLMLTQKQFFKISMESKDQVIEAAIQLMLHDYEELDKAGSDNEATQLYIDQDAKTFFFCTPQALRVIRRINSTKNHLVIETTLNQVRTWFSFPSMSRKNNLNI